MAGIGVVSQNLAPCWQHAGGQYIELLLEAREVARGIGKGLLVQVIVPATAMAVS